ncbi:MAG TPA: hypothetical protein VM008_19210 [Phycisphaerae bacterium]|nr:hypothetical protein [Phycisphaerae bacterium]
MLTISLSSDIESRLTTEANRHGLQAAEYASQLLERLLASPSVDEVLAPFRKQVADSGLSDEQLDALFENARQEVWQQQQDKKS